MNESDQSQNVQQRVVALEESVMHLEHMLKQLNEVVCTIQDRIDRQNEAINHLTEVTRRISQREPEQRSLEDDRPPHY
ncbi:MAG: SlyX family protein [Pirellulales bacterium]|nr:SlyX family protein [Pirellulales bacterium]